MASGRCRARIEAYQTKRCQRKKVEMRFAHLKRIMVLAAEPLIGVRPRRRTVGRLGTGWRRQDLCARINRENRLG